MPQAEDNSKQTEEWRTIACAPDYAISNHGRVKRLIDGGSSHAGRILTPHPRKNGGYLCVCLRRDGKNLVRTVHRQVCLAFHGEPPDASSHAAHFDGNKTNNRDDNIRWATPEENNADMVRHGTKPKGDRHWAKQLPERTTRGEKVGSSKLTADQVREILAEPQRRGITLELSAKYGVTNGTISCILRRVTWRHLSMEASHA